jgi:hypothetical protein
MVQGSSTGGPLEGGGRASQGGDASRPRVPKVEV